MWQELSFDAPKGPSHRCHQKTNTSNLFEFKLTLSFLFHLRLAWHAQNYPWHVQPHLLKQGLVFTGMNPWSFKHLKHFSLILILRQYYGPAFLFA